MLGIDASPDVIAAAAASAAERGVANVDFVVGDVYSLEHPDAQFDVVHAHQVLQHLADPVAAFREMRRVCRPDGVVAVRDCVYRSFTWYPRDARLDRWLDLYCAVAEANGGEPDAGSRLRAWALDAGFGSVTTSASAWCYAEDAGAVVVGRPVGRARHDNGARRTRAGVGARHLRRPRRSRRGLARLGRRAGRLVRRPARRGPRHALTRRLRSRHSLAVREPLQHPVVGRNGVPVRAMSGRLSTLRMIAFTSCSDALPRDI